MKSIKSVYKIGNGPSSSHTVGPYHAASIFRARYPQADAFRVTLYGSLAFTGEGHGTGKAILNGLPGAEIIYNLEETDLPHPNTMLFVAYKDGKEIGRKRIFSIGGGSIRIEGEPSEDEREVYPQKYFTEILNLCKEKCITLPQLIYRMEDPSLKMYLDEVWKAMQDAIHRGLEADGILPGGLGVTRKAKLLYNKRCYNESADVAMNRVIAAYAYAVSEENADENIVVTAPTCGSCGVLPAVLYYMHRDRGFPKDEILDSLAVAGMIGRRMRLPGGNRQCLLDDGCRAGLALRPEHRTDRVCRGNRHGAQPRSHLRPGERPRADPLHRAQCRCRHARHQLGQSVPLPVCQPQDLV